MKRRLILILLCCIASLAAQTVEASELDPDEFVPTNEWQPIREGQKVPPGIHVRLNLENGVREGKLLDPNEATSTGVIAASSNTDPTLEEISRANLEKAFATLDLSKDDVPTEESHAEEIRRKFRPYDELKKDFEALNLKIQTDQEILKELMEKLNTTEEKETQKTILTDLEYYLHQYDNGIFFADNNGLTLLLRFLNSTETDMEIRQLTSLVLGAAFQGNPQVQLKGLHLGFIQSLLRLISMETDPTMKIRLFYPLSTILRNFPPAQKQFLDYGGAEAMINTVDLSHSSNKLAVRVITLMNDLIIEKTQATDTKRSAYENLHVSKELLDRGWCTSLVNRLQLLDLEDFDAVEKTIDGFVPFADVCRAEFDLVQSIFNQIEKIYRSSAKNDETLYKDLFDDLSLLQHTKKRSVEL